MLVDRELAHEPAIRKVVIADHGVAIVIRLASTAETLPQRVDLRRTREKIPAFVVNGQRRVHHLNVVVRSDSTDRVWRENPGSTDPVEIDAYSGSRERRSRRVHRFQRSP